MNINSRNKIYPSIAFQLPEFIRIDHPTFVSFLEVYYEWLESQGSYLRSPLELSKVSDIDTTFDEFVEAFKKQYLLNFPEKLAINQETGNPVDVRKLIKHIKAFYKAKGTEKTYEFLFRILYDTNVEFYYPKMDILRASDGKWILKKTIKTTSSLGNVLFESLGRQIYQVKNGILISSATVSNISRYQSGVFEVTELELSNINGNFESNREIQFKNDSNEVLIESKIFSVVSTITIVDGGINYRIGDKVIFTNASGDTGQKADAEVIQVSSTGAIQKIKILNFGANYNLSPTITINSKKGSGFSGTTSVGAICNYDGYYANNDGKLSSNKILQDNHYYQNFSYVLKTEIVINRYKNIIKKLIHPAGLGFFGQILIKRCAEANLKKSTALIKYEVPIIGHYTPYTFNTYDNLAEWFIDGGTFAGYDPNIHDELIITAGNCNPISNNIDFVPGITADILKQEGFIRADPFWIIYNHPNKRINDSVLAQIMYEDKDEFMNTWNEWVVSSQDLRDEWGENFTGGSKYAVLQYDGLTEFRKITIGSFLTMPIGEEFDCRAEPRGIVGNHGNSPNF